MKKKEKMVCQIIRFRGNIETFLVSIDEFPSFSESATLLENSTAARPGSNDLHLALYS